MTTIATDGITIAADGLATNAWGGIASREVKKVHHEGGRVYAVGGALALMRPLIDWHMKGHDPRHTPVLNDGKWSLVVREPDGKWFLLTSDAPYPDAVEMPFAIGTGGDYALGALHAGASPERALAIACQLDVRSGGAIQVIDIAEALGLNVGLKAEPVREAAE